MVQGRYIVALKETVDHRFVTDLLQRHFPQYEIYTGKTGPCMDLIDIKRVRLPIPSPCPLGGNTGRLAPMKSPPQQLSL